MSLSLFIRGLVPLNWRAPSLGSKLFSCSDDAGKRGIEQNPFYEKYKTKLGKVQTHRSEGVIQLSPNKHQHISDSTSTISHLRHSLDSILNTNGMAHKTADEIASIWNGCCSTLACIHGTLPASSYTLMSTQGSLCPHFVYPLPSDTGYKFMFQQKSMDEFHFTTLEDYKLLTEHAPSYLTLSYFTQFAEEKNIVLMAGKYNHEKFRVEEAQLLAQLMQLYYGQNNTERIQLIRKFNITPNLFDYQELIQQFEALKFV